MYSYTGKILHIDVGTRKSRVQHVGEDYLRTYIGGVSLAARLDSGPRTLSASLRACSPARWCR